MTDFEHFCRWCSGMAVDDTGAPCPECHGTGEKPHPDPEPEEATDYLD